MSIVQSLEVEVHFTFIWLIILSPVLSLCSASHVFITIKKMSCMLLYVIFLWTSYFCFPDISLRLSQSKR